MKELAPLLLGLGLAACSAQPQQAQIPQPAQPVATEAPAPKTEFKAKEAPILGTTEQQLKDRFTIAQLVIDGKITNVAKTSSAGVTPNPIAVLAGHPPVGTDVCKLPYSALIKVMFENCFAEGMSYTQVANIVGYKGEETARSGDAVSYVWKGNKGMMSATFVGDKLTAKAQQGLN